MKALHTKIGTAVSRTNGPVTQFCRRLLLNGLFMVSCIDDKQVSDILARCHSPIWNYVIPGLTSYILEQDECGSTIRVFHSSREQQEAVTPHSHRFDHYAIVLRGSVSNRVWTRDDAGDEFMSSRLIYKGSVGRYEMVEHEVDTWSCKTQTYSPGEDYFMKADEIHSTYFGKGTVLMVWEHPSCSNESVVIEPLVNSRRIPTMEVKPWMFKQGGRSEIQLL